MAIVDIDPIYELPQQYDVVRFRNGIHDWVVTRTIPYANLVFVESVVGKRKGRAAISNILTIQRDTKVRPEKDNSLDYAWSVDEPSN